MSRFAEFSQVAYYNETRFSPPTPMFRDFQAIWKPRTRAFAPSADVSWFSSHFSKQRPQFCAPTQARGRDTPRGGGRDPQICTQRDTAEGGRSPRRRTAVP